MMLHPLFRLPKFGAGPGLHRVDALIAALGLGAYLRATPRIAITGTNGKGSTAKLCSEILRRSGRRTGLFTSPHLFRFNERIEISGAPATDELLTHKADQVLAAIAAYEGIDPDDRVGAFEAYFVLAIAAFAQARVDTLVLEAGIGGRYDAVRMARAPLAAVVSIDFDHTDILGKTLAAIALDKLEIVATGGLAVLGRTLAPLAAQMRCHAGLIGVTPLFATEASAVTIETSDAGGSVLRLMLDGQSIEGIRLNLAGPHQGDNLAIAALLAKRLLDRERAFEAHGFAGAVRGAATETRWPGRLELVMEDPAVTIDVGHSPAAIEAALAAFAAHNRLGDCLLVLGCSRDKNARDMVGLLAPRFNRILCTSAHHKGAPAAEIAAIARAANPTASIVEAATIAVAAVRTVTICRDERRAAYVAGGLFVAIELAHALRGGDPARLRFF